MMKDALFELVDTSVRKQMENSDCVLAVPARVVDALENGMYVVTLISNGSQLVLPNWSGSELDFDENVQVFYKGKILSERTAYIGASFYTGDNASRNRIKYINGTFALGEVSETARTIARVEFEAVQKTKVFAVLNANIWGNETGFSFVYVYMDGILHDYQPKTTVTANYDSVQCFNLPFDVSKGEHVLEIKASGTGNYIDIYAYIWGQGLTDKESFDPTSEADYIYSGGTIIYYIGKSKNPLLPTTLDGIPVTTVESVAFDGRTDLVSAKIPDGITRIE
jgi:hypothetical protein